METLQFVAFMMLMACHPLAVIALQSSQSEQKAPQPTEVSAGTAVEVYP